MKLIASHAGLRVSMVASAILLAGLIAFAAATGLRGPVGHIATASLLFGVPLLFVVSLAAVVLAVRGGAHYEPMPDTRVNIACIACGMLVVVVGAFAGVAYAFQ